MRHWMGRLIRILSSSLWLVIYCFLPIGIHRIGGPDLTLWQVNASQEDQTNPKSCQASYCLYFPFIAGFGKPLTNIGPDLSIQELTPKLSYSPGETIRLTLVYQNSGSQSASGVKITDTLPSKTRFDASTSDPGWNASSDKSQVTYIAGSISAGDTQSIILAVVIESPYLSGDPNLHNTVVISDDGSQGPDPNPNNNTVTLGLKVILPVSTIRIVPPTQIEFDNFAIGPNTAHAPLTVIANTPFAVDINDAGATSWHMTQWDGQTYKTIRLSDPLIVDNPAQSLFVSQGTGSQIMTGGPTGSDGQSIDLIFYQVLHYADPELIAGETYHLELTFNAYVSQ